MWTCTKNGRENSLTYHSSTNLSKPNFKLSSDWKECGWVIHIHQHILFFLSNCHCIWYLVGWAVITIKAGIIHYKVCVKLKKNHWKPLRAHFSYLWQKNWCHAYFYICSCVCSCKYVCGVEVSFSVHLQRVKQIQKLSIMCTHIIWKQVILNTCHGTLLTLSDVILDIKNKPKHTGWVSLSFKRRNRVALSFWSSWR